MATYKSSEEDCRWGIASGNCDAHSRTVSFAAQRKLRSGAPACLVGQNGTETKPVPQLLVSLLANPVGMMPTHPHAEKSASSYTVTTDRCVLKMSLSSYRQTKR